MGSNQFKDIRTDYDYEMLDLPETTENTTDIDYSNYNFSNLNYTNDSVIWDRVSAWEVAIKTTAILPIMIIGILGNLSIIILIVSLKPLRKSHINLFILNMAFADLLTTMFCPWMALVDNIYQNYELGPVFCKLEGFIKMLCLLASVLSLITISFDRFIAFVYPFKRHLNKRVSYIIIGANWALAILLASPLMIWRRYRERQWHDYLEKWCPEEHVEITKYYWLFLMLPLIYCPLLVMVIVYFVILRNLDRYEKTVSINETPVRLKQSRTILKMLFIYISTTIVCWLPLHIAIYYRKFKPPATIMGSWYINLCFIAQLFASANSAINPIVTFRKTFSHLLPKLFKSKKGTNRITPLDVLVIQQHLDMARPSLASDSTQKQIRLANINNSLESHTTSFTKHVMMKRVPEIFHPSRDDT